MQANTSVQAVQFGFSLLDCLERPMPVSLYTTVLATLTHDEAPAYAAIYATADGRLLAGYSLGNYQMFRGRWVKDGEDAYDVAREEAAYWAWLDAADAELAFAEDVEDAHLAEYA
jgi:hypothetical protein